MPNLLRHRWYILALHKQYLSWHIVSMPENSTYNRVALWKFLHPTHEGAGTVKLNIVLPELVPYH